MQQSIKLLHVIILIAILSIGTLIFTNSTNIEVSNIFTVVDETIKQTISNTNQLAQVSGAGSGLVLDYNFDNDTTSVIDSSGSGNNGTINGATLTSTDCISGKCYSFDGVSNTIDVPNSASLNPTVLTISAWVKPIGKGKDVSGYLSILSKSSLHSLSIREDGIITFYLPGVKNWVTTDKDKRNLFDGTWHHISATYDGVNQAIYIDGILIDTTPATGSITSSLTSLKIGGPFLFKGSIDEVRLYNRSLTADEVQALYLSYGQARSPQTYYISSSNGDDSFDGLTEEKPWKNLYMIYKLGAKPYGIIPGDKILLKRGDTWEGSITLDWKGKTDSSPILVGAYGSESSPNPKIYGDGRGVTWTAVAGYPGVYEADFGLGTGEVGLGSGIEAVYENNTAYAYVKLSTASDLSPGTWGQPSGLSNSIWIRTTDGNQPNNIRAFRDNVIKVTNSQNIIIENLDIEESWTGIRVSLSDSVTVRNINTFNMQNIASNFVRSTKCILDNVTAINSGNTVFYIVFGSDNIIRNSTINGVSKTISGIVSTGNDYAGIGLQQSKRNIIEHNKIINGLAGALDFYYENSSIVRYNYIENVSGFYPHGSGNVVYGNIVDGKGKSAASNIGGVPADYLKYNTYGNDGGPLPNYLLNNTFYNMGWYGMMGYGGIIRNNIVTGNVSLADYTTDGSTPINSDYNCYYSSLTPQFKVNNIAYRSLSAFQATGHDVHSVYGDPKIDPITYKIASDSPCKDMGANVSNFINFPYKDYIGTSIPQGTAPDAGAYEYSSGVLPPPSNPTLTITKSGTGLGTVSGGSINCGSTCIQTSVSGTVVTLTATPSIGSTFAGWGGSCSGLSTCSVTLNTNIAVSAIFNTTIVADSLPPDRSGASPSGTLPSNTTSVNLSLITNEASTCRYSTIPNSIFSTMTVFTTTGGLNHSSTISSLVPASYSYYVKCSDTVGNINSTDYPILFTIASPVITTDITPPSITISKPLSGETYTEGRLPISASASDNVGVVGVTFYVNNTRLGNEDLSSPYSVNWKAAVGTYTITAKVRDAAGNTTTSSPVSVTIITKGRRASWNPFRASLLEALESEPLAELVSATSQTPTTMTPLTPLSNTSIQAITPNTNYAFYRNLKLGSKGEDVRQLQILLNSKGYTVTTTGPGSRGLETTTFGPATRSALIKFQIANNITPALGYFGPITRERVR